MRRLLARQRRGATAVEFALTLPLLLILFAGVTDLGQYLYLADNLAAAVGEGARAGALSDPDDGEDPETAAETTAAAWWVAAELPSGFTVDAALAGLGAPNERLVVTGRAPFVPWFGMLGLPGTVTYIHTIRLVYQPVP
jgi:Flp pilus assembly protein TadG